MVTSVLLALGSLDAGPSMHCWDELPPPFSRQGSMEQVTVAELPDGTLWAASAEPQLARFRDGGWEAVELPTDWGDVRWPTVLATEQGELYLGIERNENDGANSARVARWSDGGWSLAMEPVPSTRRPFLHINDLTLAATSGGRPLALWTEELNVQPFGIVVAAWEPSGWKRMGRLQLKGQSYYVRPVLRSVGDEVWAGWVEEHGKREVIRLVRWQGDAWRDFPPLPSVAGLTDLTIDVLAESPTQAWFLISGTRGRDTAETMVAAWDGTRWTKAGSAKVYGHRLAMTTDGVSVIATATDKTANERLSVFAASTSDWRPLITGLHVVEGVSDVMNPRVVSAREGRVLVSLEETGPDGRSTRLVRVRPCAPKEEPRKPPVSIREEDTWPRSIAEAVVKLRSELPPDVLEKVRRGKTIEFHLGLGTGIRNQFGLWRGNKPLLNSCAAVAKKRREPEALHPETCSHLIIEALQQSLAADGAAAE